MILLDIISTHYLASRVSHHVCMYHSYTYDCLLQIIPGRHLCLINRVATTEAAPSPSSALLTTPQQRLHHRAKKIFYVSQRNMDPKHD